jgi:hypothetical protein
MAEFDLKPGTIISLILLGGLGYVAYKFWKGEWKIPGLPDIGAAITNAAAALPGAVGGIEYNIAYGRDLKKVATTPGSPERAETIAEIKDIIPGATDPQITSRTAAREAAEDVIKGPFGTGFTGGVLAGLTVIGLPLTGYTIGAGLGALTQQQRFYDTLNPTQLKYFREKEYATRAAWMWKHPIETTIGAPATVIHELTRPEEGQHSPFGVVVGLASGLLGGSKKSSGLPVIEPPPITRVETKRSTVSRKVQARLPEGVKLERLPGPVQQFLKKRELGRYG